MSPKVPYGGFDLPDVVEGREVVANVYRSPVGGDPLACELCGRLLRSTEYFKADETGAEHFWPTPRKRTLRERVVRWFKTSRHERRHERQRQRLLADNPCLQGEI